ncbi:GNAT family N-acetyltransferase [Clostridium tagluense]|uniref:N-acetyltransferase n=1 Tax=Clostridium tagluense TaxID=360422 RepID=A0A401UPT1_9CLOT|nr:GNAT family protein [Clostridium tagluense]GCD11553.1 N-acetyltransferase [Clostridium tagluense]
MKYKFINMNLEYASIIHTWKYEGEYSVYNYENDDCLLDPNNWRDMYAVLDENNDVAAEITLYNNDLPEGLENTFEQGDMFYGQGMRPDLTGKGYGPELISQALVFALAKYNYNREYVLLDVISFNKRAFKAYEKCGFEFAYEHSEECDGTVYDFIRMRYKNPKVNLGR